MSSGIIGEGVTGKFMLFLLPWNLKMIRIGWKVALVVFKGENGRRWDGKLPFLFNLPKAGSLHQNQIWRKRKERPKLIACDSINFLWTGQCRFICFSLLGFPSYFAQNVYHDHPWTPMTIFCSAWIISVMRPALPLTAGTKLTQAKAGHGQLVEKRELNNWCRTSRTWKGFLKQWVLHKRSCNNMVKT